MNRLTFISAALLVMSAALADVDSSGKLPLASADTAATIVIPTSASPSVRHAATELQTYVERMTGRRLRIIDDSANLPKNAILLGFTTFTAKIVGDCPHGLASSDAKIVGDCPQCFQLGDDGFRLVARPPHLLVLGSEKRGVLYGVYELLERFGGCRWYSLKTEIVPRIREFSVPSDLDDTQIPAFESRAPFWYEVLSNPQFAARLKVNWRPRRAPTPAQLGGEDFRYGKKLGNAHTFMNLLPVAKYGKEHPEYYALVDGVRCNDAGKGGKGEVWRSQPCLTNPDVVRIMTANTLDLIRQDPTARYYGLCFNDNGNYCRCPKCAAVDAEEGSHSGTLVRFVNTVAEAVEKEFPKAVIVTAAYTFTRKPPKLTRLRHNVLVCLCSIECDFARPFVESPYAENKKFIEDVLGWQQHADGFAVWDYTTAFMHYPIAFPNVRSLQSNIQFFRDHRVVSIFEQGDSPGAHADFAELKTWLIAKWMWNPDLPMKPLLDDFFAGYYGAAAPYVRRYFERVHDLQQAYSADPKRPLKIEVTYRTEALGDDFYAEADELWRQASAAVKDDPMHAYNVRMGAFGNDYTRFLRHNPQFFFDTSVDTNVCRELARSLVARQAEGNIRLGEIPANHQSFLDLMKRVAATPPVVAKDGKMGLEESVLLELRRGYWGDFVADPEAGDGRALEIYNTHHQWCVNFELSQVAFTPDKKYKFNVRIRAPLIAGVEGNVFSAGIYDSKAKKSLCSELKLKTTDIKPGYAWYEIADIEPNTNCLLWMAPGVRKKSETPAFESVFIDRLAIVEE